MLALVPFAQFHKSLETRRNCANGTGAVLVPFAGFHKPLEIRRNCANGTRARMFSEALAFFPKAVTKVDKPLTMRSGHKAVLISVCTTLRQREEASLKLWTRV